MHTRENDDLQELIEVQHYRPAVSIIQPLDIRINEEKELTHLLKIAADKVDRLLARDYPDEIREMVMAKLKALIRNTNWEKDRKSIALFVSPVFEKIVYLDIPVQEKIVVNESFEIRDLVWNARSSNKFLILVLSEKESKVFLGSTDGLFQSLSSAARNIHALVNDLPERVANFSDPSDRHEILMEKLLRSADAALGVILKTYALPVFVVGAERTAGHFRKLSAHRPAIAAFIHGNYEHAGQEELSRLVEPYVKDWQRIRQKEILKKMEEAAGRGKLASGIRDVWHDAMNTRGRLLIVENNFMFAAQQGSRKDSIYRQASGGDKSNGIHDAVDRIIGNVLANGGDVEFVDEGLLKDHHHIALINFY